MTENTNEDTRDNTNEETHDVEGHRVHKAPVDERLRHGGGGLVEDEDVEGHRVHFGAADEISDDGIDFERPR